MNTQQLVKDLDTKIANLEEQLQALRMARQALVSPEAKTPKAPKLSKSKPARKKPNWSPAMRKAAAERMRKYWAKRTKKTVKKA